MLTFKTRECAHNKGFNVLSSEVVHDLDRMSKLSPGMDQNAEIGYCITGYFR